MLPKSAMSSGEREARERVAALERENAALRAFLGGVAVAQRNHGFAAAADTIDNFLKSVSSQGDG